MSVNPTMSYDEFLAQYSAVLGDMADTGITPSEAVVRFRTVYPDAPAHYLDKAMVSGQWFFVGRRESPINNVMIAAALWYAVAETLELEPDPHYAAVRIDPIIMQDVPRMLEMAQVSAQNISLVMSKIGATLNYLTKHPYASLDESEYVELLENPTAEMREVDTDAVQWPPTAEVISDRLGNGSWATALLRTSICPPDIDEMGFSVDPNSISDREFRNALSDFLSYCVRYDRKPSVLLYGAWSTDRDHLGKVPLLGAIRGRYGSWHIALQKGRKLINDAVAMGSAKAIPVSAQRNGAAMTIEELNAEGIGVVTTSALPFKIPDEASGWISLNAVTTSRLEELPVNQTLRIFYLSPDMVAAEEFTPFVSVLRSSTGYRCELTPTTGFENITVTLDPHYLLAHGWFAPSEVSPVWSHSFLDVQETATAVLNAMQFGAGCSRVDYFQSDAPSNASGADAVHPHTGSVPMVTVAQLSTVELRSE
ncbi:hypothetical protein [Rothia sp. ZJ932]|uniref:hypothetical protein n=1 Tax=Rothia sp. ZJ932 TaxID=2810516 RepID=UPI00196821C8|nr:hypothetical protein [Rothia sp. ZJ932]QRZ61280.1 hypothetical protein JR346_08545 [Rothia sp. ZJ932]